MNRQNLVIAGSYDEYKKWIWSRKHLKGFELYKFIAQEKDLMGYKKDGVIFILVGQYWKNPTYKSDRYKYLIEELPAIFA
jgi:hypothetical protein